MRQQSKEIAEDVRNKVRSEKKKQLSSVEQKGADNLQKWQARKLLDLHDQYQECLKDIGLGHREAELIANQENNSGSYVVPQARIAKDKMQKTTKKSDLKKNEVISKRPSVIQGKTVKVTENVRSGMVSQIYRKKSSPFKRKKIKKKVTPVKPNGKILSESDDSENDAARITVNISQESTKSSSTTSTESSKNGPLPTAASEVVGDNGPLVEQLQSVHRSTVINVSESERDYPKADSVLGKIIIIYQYSIYSRTRL